ncbi:MAG: formylglycine-generating enzyme family protein [Planctomycetota bacterium]|jgi:formylglycine-generating enzyme required for sulfatase activity
MRRPEKNRIRALAATCVACALAFLGCGEAPDTPGLAQEIVNSIGMTLVLIPEGEFRMGSPASDTDQQPNESPPHRVRITRPFYLGRHEVTVANFRAFVEATGYRTEAERDEKGGFGIDFETATVRQGSSIVWHSPGFPGFRQGDDHPVLLISWRDAEAFCRWLSQKEGRSYRLPTEAEWEYAARGGTTTTYWTGNAPADLRGAANLADASLEKAVPAAKWAEPWDDGHAFTAPVGSLRPNPFGLHDMHGNVWEWCLDRHSNEYYRTSPVEDPQGPETGAFRAIRGGGWFNPARQNRSAQRIYFAPTFRYCLLSGFRVLLEAG